MILSESHIEASIRNYLEKKGWKTTNLPKTVGQHGADITAWHPKWRKIYIIEVKGELKNNQAQVMHGAFYNLLGQILARMNKEGNDTRKARYYGLGIPKKWEKAFLNKISNMKYGWGLLKLKVFLVDSEDNVEEKPYSYFLEQK